MASVDESAVTRADLLKGAAGFAFAFGLAGCGDGGNGGTDGSPATGAQADGPAERGGVLRFASGEADVSEGLDPALLLTSNATSLSSALYEGLVRVDAKRKVTPWLAEKWNVRSDAKEWTFTLREDVKFHDGKPLTAEDVAYSIGRLLDSKLGSPAFPRLTLSVTKSGLKPVDDRTIRFELKQPDAFLTLALAQAWMSIVPAGTSDFKDGNGTGPFILKSFAPGLNWEVERNPSYWESSLPYLDGIRAVVIPEQATKLQSVVSGNSDLADRLNPSLVPTAKSNSAVQLLIGPNQAHFHVGMTTTLEPFNDPRVVRAVKLAADRDTLLKAVTQGPGVLTSDTPVPSTDALYPPDLGIREQDVDEAKRLLAEAGFADGIDLTLFSSEIAGGMSDFAAAFKEVVAPAGIRVTIKQDDPGTFYSRRWLQAPMFTSYWFNRHPNETLNLTFASTAPFNEGKIKIEKLDELLKQGAATVDPEKQVPIYQEALQIVADEGASSIPFFIDTVWVAKKRVHGVSVDPERFVRFDKGWLG